jgi:hypothetical protein
MLRGGLFVRIGLGKATSQQSNSRSLINEEHEDGGSSSRKRARSKARWREPPGFPVNDGGSDKVSQTATERSRARGRMRRSPWYCALVVGVHILHGRLIATEDEHGLHLISENGNVVEFDRAVTIPVSQAARIG